LAESAAQSVITISLKPPLKAAKMLLKKVRSNRSPTLRKEALVSISLRIS